MRRTTEYCLFEGVEPSLRVTRTPAYGGTEPPAYFRSTTTPGKCREGARPRSPHHTVPQPIRFFPFPSPYHSAPLLLAVLRAAFVHHPSPFQIDTCQVVSEVLKYVKADIHVILTTNITGIGQQIPLPCTSIYTISGSPSFHDGLW